MFLLETLLMARRDTSPAPAPATPAADVAPPPAPPAATNPPPVPPPAPEPVAPKRWTVSRRAVGKRTVEADDEDAAVVAFDAHFGIIKSEFPAEVQLVTDDA